MPEAIHKTLTKTAYARYTDKGSRFYAHAYPVMDQKTIEHRRSELAVTYPDATHHCYAWRFNPFNLQEYAQDDGEPAGTAGLPILGVIKSEELVNVLIIVVRYFGGTKLGKPGLVQAYREAATLSVAAARKTAIDRFIPFRITYPYEQENRICELINRYRLETDDEQYLEFVTMTLFCKADLASSMYGILEHLSHLGISFRQLPECFRPVDFPE